MQGKKIKAILLMAGVGRRFGSDLPKQFHRLAGKKVYQHTLEVFLKVNIFAEIILVCPAEWMSEVKQDITTYSFAPLTLVEGGSSRQESSLKGLLACGNQTDIVVIHDAVRPFLSQELLLENITQAIRYRAVDTCIPSADTLVHAPTREQIASIPSRAEYLRGQTPQSFDYALIKQAHLHAEQTGSLNSSDDCSLVLNLGHPVQIVLGSEENIKITSELDLFLAEQILRLRNVCSSSLPETIDLSGKKIAVTGGSGGIGSAICQLLEQVGAVPLRLSRSSTDYPIDLTCYTATQAIFEQILKQHGPLDGLINCLGTLTIKSLDELSVAEIDRQVATNLNAVIYSCKCVQLKPKAHILNIASSSYVRGKKNYAVYASAKAAVVNFTQGLAEERPDLYINTLVPQRTLTAMRLANFPDEHPSTLLDPAEIAQEVLRLLKQTHLTGTIVEVKRK